MADPTLPPGCTTADIDRHMGGDYPKCYVCESLGELEEAWFRGQVRLLCATCDGQLEDSDGD